MVLELGNNVSFATFLVQVMTPCYRARVYWYHTILTPEVVFGVIRNALKLVPAL